MLTISLLFACSFFDVLCYELMEKKCISSSVTTTKNYLILDYTLKADFYRGGRKV